MLQDAHHKMRMLNREELAVAEQMEAFNSCVHKGRQATYTSYPFTNVFHTGLLPKL